MKLSLVYWLIAAAVLANAVVFFWPGKPAPAPEQTGAGSLRELKLLREVDEALPARRPAPAPPSRQEPDTAMAVNGDALDGEVADAPSEPLEADPVSSPELPAEQPQAAVPAASESAPASPADVAATDVAATVEEPAPEPAPVSVAGPRRCWIAGPVDSDTLSERLAATFAAEGIGLDLVLQTVEIAPDNWVYLPTSGSQADVRRLSRELRESGYDNFQITDGPLAGSLSMGLFRSRERAAALRDRLRALGQQADIYLRPAFSEQPWAAIDDVDREALGWPAETGGLPGFDTLELRERECPEDGGG